LVEKRIAEGLDPLHNAKSPMNQFVHRRTSRGRLASYSLILLPMFSRCL
jgi:hypothetical protein